MSKEFKHYGLKPARVVRDLGPLSAVAIFTCGNIVETYAVQFNDTLVHAAGMKLPRGVSKMDPAYIHVYQCDERTFDVWAIYLNSGEGKLLWTCKVKPVWLKYPYSPEQHHAHRSSPPSRASAITARTNPRHHRDQEARCNAA